MLWLVVPSGFCDVLVWMQINSTEANHSEGLFCPWVIGAQAGHSNCAQAGGCYLCLTSALA